MLKNFYQKREESTIVEDGDSLEINLNGLLARSQLRRTRLLLRLVALQAYRSLQGSVKSVFKAWEQRLNSSEGHLESNEGDPELIVFIPVTSDVKIKSITVVGGADGTSPAKMRAFINRDGIDFSDTQNMQAVQNTS